MNIVSKPNSTTKNKTGGWRTMKPEVDKNKCIACGLCAKACPEEIIKIDGKADIDYDYCKGCGLCAKVCPVKAILMRLDEK